MGPVAPNPPQAANDAATQSKGLGGNAHGHWRMSVHWEWVGNERRPCIIYLYVYIYIYADADKQILVPLRVQRTILFRNTNSNTNIASTNSNNRSCLQGLTRWTRSCRHWVERHAAFCVFRRDDLR